MIIILLLLHISKPPLFMAQSAQIEGNIPFNLNIIVNDQVPTKQTTQTTPSYFVYAQFCTLPLKALINPVKCLEEFCSNNAVGWHLSMFSYLLSIVEEMYDQREFYGMT